MELIYEGLDPVGDLELTSCVAVTRDMLGQARGFDAVGLYSTCCTAVGALRSAVKTAEARALLARPCWTGWVHADEDLLLAASVELMERISDALQTEGDAAPMGGIRIYQDLQGILVAIEESVYTK